MRLPREALAGLGHRYYLLLLASLLSDVGSYTTQTAVTLAIFRLSGQDAASMGISTLANLVPSLLASPLGGVCAERYDRRWVMIANDVLRLPLVLLLAVSGNLWVLMGLQACVAASTAVFMPSRQSILPELVPEQHLNLANSLSGGVLSLVHVLGPVLGAVLYIAGDGLRWVVLLDGATYVASALLLLAIRYRRAPGKGARESVLREVVDGLRYVRGAPDLGQLLLLTLGAGTAMGIMLPLLRPFVTEALHGGDATYARLIGAFGLGGLVAPLVGYLAGRHLGFGRTVQLGFLAEASMMLVWSRVGDPTVSSLIMFVWGVNIFAVISNQFSYLQTSVDREYLGRTFALLDQAMVLPQLLGAGIVALLGGHQPAPTVITAASVLYLVVVVVSLPTRGARLLRSRRPAPEAPALAG